MRFIVLLTGALAVLALGACGSDDPAAPRNLGVEPEIVNNTDVFQFQVSSVDGYTGTLTYAWDNTGELANVDQSSAIDPGQAILKLLDADGAEVYSRDLSEDGSSASAAGTAGTWTVRITLTELSGTVNFRAEKRTP
jgi:hypothetical protein